LNKNSTVIVESKMKTLPWVLAVFTIVESCFPSYKPGPGKCSCGVPFNKRRIIGGRPALIQEYPWQVALFKNSSDPLPFCGGSLLSSTTVLTAAHCVDAGIKSVIVAFPNGDVSLENATKIVTSNIEVHPNYRSFYNLQSAVQNYDFAVLTLPTPISFTENTMPICLPDPTEQYEQKFATVTGWGATQWGLTPQLTSILMAVNMTTLSNEQCKTLLGLATIPAEYQHLNLIPGALTPNMICASAYEEKKSFCLGDSGGPLITLSKDSSYYSQIGVVSWGDCVSVNVFSRVTQQIYWIMRKITGQTCAPPVVSDEL